MKERIKKLIEQYKEGLKIKQKYQEEYREQKKKIVDIFDYNAERKRENNKINLVKISAEIKLIEEFIKELEDVIKWSTQS